MGTYTGSDKRLKYLFQSGGGGGTTVVANPAGQATDTLNKLQVGQTIYNVPSGGGGGSETYSTTPQQVGTWTDGRPVYKVVVTGLSLAVNTSWSNAFATNLNIAEVIDAEFYDETQGVQVAIEQVQALSGGVRIQHVRNVGRTISRAILTYVQPTSI